MNRGRACIALVIGVTLLVSVQSAFAGGIAIRSNTISFVGPGPLVEPRAKVTVRFLANEYTYGGNNYGYVAWAVAPASAPDYPKREQIDSWKIYGVLISTPDGAQDLAEAASPYELTFAAPEKPGQYKVMFDGVPIFRPVPLKSGLGYKQSFIPDNPDRRELARAITAYLGALQVVVRFQVSATPIVSADTPTLYLRMNGQVPSSVKTPGGIQSKPIAFSWTLGPEFTGDAAKVDYRYRLDPDDDDKWGAWTTLREVRYPFLLKGIHQFSVQARYAGPPAKESSPASYQFNLDRDHVSKPTKETLTKGLIGASPTPALPIQFSEVYAHSRALVVGMWKFDDKHFPQFDENKIAADVSAMESALKKNGFEVTTLKQQRIKREDVMAALSKLVDGASRDDRLFVYFSTHGFPDPGLPSDAYLATSDCQYTEPTVRCLRLNDLQTQADRAIDGKQVRQILFAVDSCFSGLGIVRKSVGVPDLTRLAIPSGAFMLTAGMANQLAQIDPNLGMSTFTHFLAEGLNGNADILGNNGLITLSELFVYVQYKVAEQTKAQQIPMLGRMKGEGEMLFLPSR